MKKLILLATVLILAGCAGQRVWTKPGGTPEKFQQDKWECQAQAGQISGGTGEYANPWLVKDLTMDCLRMRGWQANR